MDVKIINMLAILNVHLKIIYPLSVLWLNTRKLSCKQKTADHHRINFLIEFEY